MLSNQTLSRDMTLNFQKFCVGEIDSDYEIDSLGSVELNFDGDIKKYPKYNPHENVC